MSNLTERVDQLSSSQRMLLALKEARTKLEALEQAKTEPIAIIGMGCRFPGGSNDPDAFWRILHDGVDAIAEIPNERWNIETYYDPNPDTQGKMYTRSGGFVEQVDQFDPQFFGISPREAASMDPQQRLLLEVTWEALERAGIAPSSLAGSKTGVFVGIGQNDYAQLQLNSGDPTNISAYDGTGNGFCFASGRLSYVLGLQGPNIAIDTACSSSLVAIHQACQSLRTGECNLALTGGVHLILSPEVTLFLSRTQALSPDGHCHTFDAAANGFARGEGCGVLVLKRLRDAVASGDNILAMIRGSAVNHDGRSSGFTVPNGSAQQALIRSSLANAKVEPASIDYVEVHGTGTSLGDPIEVGALGAVLSEGRSKENPLIIGSVKTNIGHLEAAAGVAGIIKVVLSLQNKEIPPHLHFQQPNPDINWDALPVVVPKSRMLWSNQTEEKRRLAGVSSFGMSGTNAHIILEEPGILEPLEAEVERPLHLLTLSAKTEEALKQLAVRYQDYLVANPSLDIGDICFTANTGRSHFTHRLSVVASSSTQMFEKLQNFSAGEESVGVFKGRGSSLPKVAFLFTGQGSQYVGMGRQLYETQPTFRTSLDRCDEILRPYLQKPLLSVLYPESGETSPLNETAYTQPALFALEYSLVQLWKSWGIKPTAVMGHSVGEYVAACVAGVFSLEDGLKLISERARLMQKLPQDGEMVAVFADITAIRAVAEIDEQKVAIAALNGPKNTVISGETQAVRTICNTLALAGITTKKLQTSHAFHSPMMEPILAEFYQVAATVTYAAPQINLISNLTGERLTSETNFPEYWCHHLRSCVRFAEGLKTLHTSGYEVFVEIGPKPTLLGMGRHCLPDVETQNFAFLPSLRQGQSEWQQMLQSLGELYTRGVSVDWSAFDQGYPRRRIVLPTYPFQRQRYWVEKTESEHLKADNLSQETVQTLITNLTNLGDTQQLVQHLEATEELSEDELKVLPKLLDLLVKQNQQQLVASSIKDWFYETEWQVKPRHVKTQEKNGFHKTGSWLIFADSDGVGKTLATLLHSRGYTCILVYAGDTYKIKEAGTWNINPNNPADFERLFQEALLTLEQPLQGVVHLWSLEAQLASNLTISSLEEAQTVGVGSVLNLIKGLGKNLPFSQLPFPNHYSLPRLWLVTRGAVSVCSELPEIAQASLWGMGKVVALEHPKLWGGMVDLAPESTTEEATKLLAEIEDSFGEDHIAFRNGNRYVARLVPKQLPESKKVAFRSDGTYLITGGLGALGLSVARWMVEKGAGQLVLIGRREASPETGETLRQLEQLGAKVVVAQADVSERGDMVRVLETIQTSMPPLMGIIHAAGVVGYEAIEDIAPDSLASVLSPKVMGTWILHHLTQEIKLDFFISFSSIASVWGSKGQAHYAAANHFLDMLAHYRQGLGLPALTVNWGPWAGGGMAVDEFQTWLSRMGVQALQPGQALTALESLLGANCTQTTVANVDWSLFKEVYEARGKRSLLELLGGQPQAAKLPRPSVRQSEILESSQIVKYLQEEIRKVLGFGSAVTLDPQQPLLELGLDSMMALQLKNSITTDFEVNVPIEKFIDGSTIIKLAEELFNELVLGDTIPLSPSLEENDLEVIKQYKEDYSTSFASFALAATSNQDSWIEGEL